MVVKQKTRDQPRSFAKIRRSEKKPRRNNNVIARKEEGIKKSIIVISLFYPVLHTYLRSTRSNIVPMSSSLRSQKGQRNDVVFHPSFHFDGFTSSSDEDDTLIHPRSIRSKQKQKRHKKQKVEPRHAGEATIKQSTSASPAVVSRNRRKRRVTQSPLELATEALPGLHQLQKKRKKNQYSSKNNSARVTSSMEQPGLRYKGSATSARQPSRVFDVKPPPHIKRTLPIQHDQHCFSHIASFTGLMNQATVPDAQTASATQDKTHHRLMRHDGPAKFRKKSSRPQGMRHHRLVILLVATLSTLCNNYNSTVPYCSQDRISKIHIGWKKNATGMPRDSIFLSMDGNNEDVQFNDISQWMFCHWPLSIFC